MRLFKLLFLIGSLMVMSVSNIFASGFYIKGEAEYIQDAKIKNIDMEQWRVLSSLGYKLNSYLSGALILGAQDASLNDFRFSYNSNIYQNLSYKMKFTYGAELQGGKVFTAGPLSFGYNARIIKTDYKDISGVQVTSFKQTIMNFDIISKYSLNDNASPYISVGYFNDKLTSPMLTSANNESDKNLRVKLGLNIKLFSNILFDLSGTLVGEQGAKIGVKYICGPAVKSSSKSGRKISDEPNAPARKISLQKKTSGNSETEIYWICKNGHKYDKETKYCIECGGNLEKVELKKNESKADNSSLIEIETLETASDKLYWICKNGHKFDKEMKFCIDCGEVLEKVEPVIQRHMITKYINICPACGKEYDIDSKFCTDDGSKLNKKRILSKPQFKFVDDKGNVYFNENEVPRNVKATKYQYDEKVLVGYQSLGTGKIYKEKLNFCPETGKPIIPLYR